jgi:hypothetical protein
MENLKRIRINKELDVISLKHHGLLRPADIVKYAENPETVLHSCFNWNNAEAALEYRLWQAREIIQVYVVVLENFNTPVRAYVSLKPDRSSDDGGYRSIISVMSNAEQRKLLLKQAYEEFVRVEETYKTLEELSVIFKAIRKVKKKIA